MECEYCGQEAKKTSGKLYVRTSGEKLFFCSGKCKKNWEQDRGHKYPEKE